MNKQACDLDEIAAFLQHQLLSERYPGNEQGGIYRPSPKPVARLGLVLHSWSGLPTWISDNQLDALWIHRPWAVDFSSIPADLGVLYSHLPFDENLTVGYNLLLANLLGAVGQPEPLGFKQSDTDKALPQRPIGMLVDVVTEEFDAVLQAVSQLFNGYDRAEAGRCQTRQHAISRIAVVGAMNESLIREAHSRGANLYLTGQYRKMTQKVVDETGIAVIAVGHQRSEAYGLRMLADLIHEKWPAMSVLMPIQHGSVSTVGSPVKSI
ncbi:Nif3-like dinuclear metal center hexameric protein [Spirosoma sp. SC4-14]|uniref:Nif3-like dinuclear metal center hexameric protein n=1 Tax=Spirosoma sp. SC4-14 TaxID=3128900 RepID=UPI0030D56719